MNTNPSVTGEMADRERERERERGGGRERGKDERRKGHEKETEEMDTGRNSYLSLYGILL